MRVLIILASLILYSSAQLEQFKSEGIDEVLEKAPAAGLTVSFHTIKILQ